MRRAVLVAALAIIASLGLIMALISPPGLLTLYDGVVGRRQSA